MSEKTRAAYAARKKTARSEPAPTAGPAPQQPTVSTVSVTDLVGDQANVRVRDDRAKSTIAASLRQFGPARSIVRSNGIIRAGNGTLEAFVAAGGTEALVVRPEPGQLVVVDRDDWTPTEAVGYSIADNRSAELADWDETGLAAQLSGLRDGGADLAAIGFDDSEIDGLIKKLGDELLGQGSGAEDPGGHTDRGAELQQKWQTARGQLWEIGRHRLLCGDSTSAEDVAIVMADDLAVIMNTDPPYGVAYSDEVRVAAERAHGRPQREEKWSRGIENDSVDGEKLQAFLEAAIRAAVPHLVDNAAFYLWHPMLTQGTFFAAAAAAADILIHRQIIWCKPSLLFGFGDYHWQHELCFYGWRRGARPNFLGERNQTTLWDMRNETAPVNRMHPTQKPVELFTRPILNHTEPGDAIYEPFAGSGSQFVAAEQTGRLCRGIEIEPKYCAVILERLAGMGLEPRLVA